MRILLAVLLMASFGIVPVFAEDFSYSPLRLGQSPWGELPTEQQIEEDIRNLSAGSTDKIRVFESVSLEPILRLSHQYGLKVSVELDASNKETLISSIDHLVPLNSEYPGTVASVIVGDNEVFSNNLDVDNLIWMINQAKNTFGVPVTSINNHLVWELYPELVDAVDFIMADAFIQDKIENPALAVKVIENSHDLLQEKYPDKRIVLETGWSTVNSSKGGQEKFVTDLQKTDLEYFLFEYADEDWQKTGFGILTADRTEKVGSDMMENNSDLINPKNNLKYDTSKVIVKVVNDYVTGLQNDPTTQAVTTGAGFGIGMIALYALKFFGYWKTGSDWGPGYVGQ